MTQNTHRSFAQADIHEFASNLVEGLLTKIESAGTAEKIAENDHLMKCTCLSRRVFSIKDIFRVTGLMRVVMTARQTLMPGYEHILARLVAILGVISKNPSNPRFDQFIFESISSLMRYLFEHPHQGLSHLRRL